MKTFKLLLSSVLCTVGIGMANADLVTSTSQLSNTKVYTIKTGRGYMTLNTAQTTIVSSHKQTMGTVNDAAATDDESKQFGIFNFEGKYFLYSPKLNKFACLVNQNLYMYNDRGIALDITTDGTGNPDGSTLRFFAYGIGSEGDSKWCLNNNNSGGIVLNSYTTPEGGNTVSIEEVEGKTLDEATVKAAFNGVPDFFDPHKVYNITNVRTTAWTANADNTGLIGTKSYNKATAEQQQFAFFKYEGKQYLYNVGAKKFVATDGALTDSKSEAATVSVWYTGNNDYPYCFYIEERGLLFNGQGSGSFSINSWNNALDDGNRHNLVEVADVDKYDEILAIFEIPSWKVTYNIYFNDEKIATAEKVQDKDSEASLPSSMLKPFCTYEYDQTTIAEGVTEVNVTATWGGPFKISTDYATANWYDMAMRGTWYVTSAVKDASGAYKTQNANTMGLVEDSYQWAFIGNPYDGFKIINKAAGDGYSFGWTDNNAKDGGIPTIMADDEGHHTWGIVSSTNTSVPANSFCLNVPGTNLYINQYGGAGGSVKFWNSTGNVGDAGSAFTVFDVPTDFSSFVKSDIAPYVESTAKYFVLTDAAKAEIGYDESYKTECSFETYKAMKEKLDAVSGDIANYILPANGYYTMKNKMYGTYMGIDPSDAKIYGNYETATAAKQIVKLEKTGENTYAISLMGKHAPKIVAQSADVIASDEMGNYTVYIPVVGYAAFQADANAQYSSLHCAASGNVVGWVASADASMWEVEDAVSIDFAIGETGYATAYLPFPVDTPEGVTACAGQILNTDAGKYLSLTELKGTIPAETPVVLKGDEGSYTFAIVAAEVPALNVANDLKGTLKPIKAAGKYVLAQPDGGKIGFYQTESGNIAATEAYLDVEDEAKFFLFECPTGISKVNAEGLVVDGPIYNLMGQRLQKMQNGINVMSGKKILK